MFDDVFGFPLLDDSAISSATARMIGMSCVMGSGRPYINLLEREANSDLAVYRPGKRRSPTVSSPLSIRDHSLRDSSPQEAESAKRKARTILMQERLLASKV
jgi:hypothetical protein